jgi:hypothetical protein
MARLLTAFPRSFTRFADGAAGARRRQARAGAAVEGRWLATSVPAARVVVADRVVAAEERVAPVVAMGDARGPGWFESSWELRSGLEVQEGLPGDLGAHEWLEAFCASAPAVATA